MSHNIYIHPDVSKEEIYKIVLKILPDLINPAEPIITNLSNFTALIKQYFKNVSWVGFYLFRDNELYLGPFQGKVACTKISVGNGVCGTAFKNRKSLVIPDVEKFEGHIACDSESRSEIVVPLILHDDIFGVLDLDSYNFNAFDEIDLKYLEEICSFIVNILDFKSFIIE